MNLKIIRNSAVLIVLMLFFALLFYPAASQPADPKPTVMVTSYTVYPEVLMPGDSGTITLTITNPAEEASQTETTVEKGEYETITTETVISINTRIKTVRLLGKGLGVATIRCPRGEYLDVGNLGPGESIDINFEIKAIEEGTFFPLLWIDVKEGSDINFPLIVKVDSSEVEISADAPPSIAVGEITPVGLTVFNTRKNKIEAVRIVPVTKGVKFSPSEFSIGTMEPDEVVNASFDVTVEDSLGVGEKEIEAKVEYKNGDNYHESYCKIPVQVVHSYGMRLVAKKFPLSIKRGEIANIVLDIGNSRSDEVQSVIAIPLTKGLVYQPSEYYIGNMKPGDLYTANFDVDSSNMKPGVNNLDFKVIYKDANGYHLESDVCTLTLNVMPEAKKTNPFIIPIVAIVIIIVVGSALYIWRRKRKV